MKSRYIIIISAFLLLLSAIGGIFLWWPGFEDFLRLKKELKSKESELSQKESYFVRLNDISNKLKDYSAELSKIDSALSIDPSIPALFNFIRGAVLENGLVIDRLNLEKVTPSLDNSDINEISFSLSISGTYPAFKNFLSTVYKSSRMIEADNIIFSSPQESDLFDFNLRMTTYSYLLGSGQSLEKEGLKRY